MFFAILSSFCEFLRGTFPWELKKCAITRKFICIKHVDLLQASDVLNVSYKIRHICKGQTNN